MDIGGVFAMLLLLAAYFLPTLVAAARSVPNLGSVAVVNVFLGWTFVGWVVALAMACRSRPQGIRITNLQTHQIPPPGPSAYRFPSKPPMTSLPPAPHSTHTQEPQA
jgi:hypothetical protein